jgi:hypothetical protein
MKNAKIYPYISGISAWIVSLRLANKNKIIPKIKPSRSLLK